MTALQLRGDIKSLGSKVGDLEDLKLAAAKDSMGDAAAAMLSDLTEKTGNLESEISAIKVCGGWLLFVISSLVFSIVCLYQCCFVVYTNRYHLSRPH